MKKLILTIAALVIAGTAHASGVSKETTTICKAVGSLAESIAKDRDAGETQTDLIRGVLDSDASLNMQRIAITMIEAIYNDDAFVRQPPAKIGSAYLLACIAKLGPKRPV